MAPTRSLRAELVLETNPLQPAVAEKKFCHQSLWSSWWISCACEHLQ